MAASSSWCQSPRGQASSPHASVGPDLVPDVAPRARVPVRLLPQPALHRRDAVPFPHQQLHREIRRSSRQRRGRAAAVLQLAAAEVEGAEVYRRFPVNTWRSH
jgi:hypothetical protein